MNTISEKQEAKWKFQRDLKETGVASLPLEDWQDNWEHFLVGWARIAQEDWVCCDCQQRFARDSLMIGYYMADEDTLVCETHLCQDCYNLNGC